MDTLQPTLQAHLQLGYGWTKYYYGMPSEAFKWSLQYGTSQVLSAKDVNANFKQLYLQAYTDKMSVITDLTFYSPGPDMHY